MITTVQQTDWRGWKITDEQAEQIRDGNAEARDAFYFDNLERIRKMAYGYVSKCPRLYSFVDDMVQGVYVDLTLFETNKYTLVDGLRLSRFIYNSFLYAQYGGLVYLAENNPKKLGDTSLKIYFSDTFSLDRPFGRGDVRHQNEDNARTLAEVIPASETIYNEDYTGDLKNILRDLLTKRENEYICHYIDGYSNKEISRLMGYKGENNNGPRVKEKLRKNSDIILARLSKMGIDVDYYKGIEPYNPTTERSYKLPPEVRAYWAQKARERRARKKADSFESVLSN